MKRWQRVSAISLNRDEVRQASTAKAGWQPYWDVAGTVEIAAERFYGIGGASLYGLTLFRELRQGPAAISLKRLATLVATDQLQPHISVEAPWTEVADLAQ